jgi:hypothetical protein
MTYQQLYRTFFTEAAGRSASAVAAKGITRAALEGRVREIRDVSNELDKLDTPTQALVQGWMSGNVNIQAVPEHARPVAAHARLIFDELTTDLLQSGLIKDNILKQTLQSNIGTYVPRLFLRYELETNGPEVVNSWLKAQGKDWGYISSKNYLKARANIPQPVLDALGEINDNPGFLLARRGTVVAADIEQARYHRLLMASPENVIPTQTLRQAKTVQAANKATIQSGGTVQFPPNVRLYEAEGGMKAAEWNGRTYWQMPDSARYGLLRNQYVEQAVASDIRSTFETTSGLQKLFNAPLAAFKFNKAVFNPASQIRNMVTNTILADVVGGVSPWRMDKWGKGFNDLRSGNDWYKRARRAGTFGGEFTTSEIMGLLDSHVPQSTSMMDFIGQTVPKFAHKPADFFTKWHQSSEAWGRMTTFRHAVEKLGMTDEMAAQFARKVIPDYQDVARWVKVVRSSPFGAPFISFCVSPDTEILTRSGWKTHDRLAPGEFALSLNLGTGKSEWRKVKDVYRGRFVGDLLHFKDRHLDMLLTPDHSCVADMRRRIPGKRAINATEWTPLGLTKASEINTRHRIPVSVPYDGAPRDGSFTDDQVRLIGWFVTEGYWRQYTKKYASLCQSVPGNVVIIRDLLDRLGGHYNERKSKAMSNNCTPRHRWLYVWHLRKPLWSFIVANAPNKSLTMEFVLALTEPQLQILVETMMLGDGHKMQAFTQNPGETAESFRVACTLAGISNGYCSSGARSSTQVTLRKLDSYALKRTKPKRIQYDGLVWCPEIETNGTWFARRNGKVFFTGNSYKAIPRSLEAAFAFGDPKKMMRFWKYPLAMAALNEYSAQQHGLLGKGEEKDIFSSVRRIALNGLSAGIYSPDHYDTFRKYLPGNVGQMQIAIPWRDQYDRQQYLDGTFFLPWGDAGEMGKGEIGKKTFPFLPRQIEPSNPYFQLGVAAVTGKDLFTGKDIIPAGAMGMEATSAWAKFMMQSWGPSLAPGAGWGAQSIQKSFSGDFASDPNVKSRGTAVAADLIGARARPVDPASAYPFKYFEMKKQLDSAKSEILSTIRSLPPDTELTPEVIAQIRSTKPSAKLSRALDRYQRIVTDFVKKYPADDLPPSPQKLLDAMKARAQ